MQPEAVNPRRMAFAAKITVTRYLGFLYTASRYTFSPPERGIIVPNSSQMKRPQNDRMKPSTQSMRDAPTDPTDPRIEEGVEKMPVPMMRPTLDGEELGFAQKTARYERTYMRSVQLNTPRCRPMPPAASGAVA